MTTLDRDQTISPAPHAPVFTMTSELFPFVGYLLLVCCAAQQWLLRNMMYIENCTLAMDIVSTCMLALRALLIGLFLVLYFLIRNIAVFYASTRITNWVVNNYF